MVLKKEISIWPELTLGDLFDFDIFHSQRLHPSKYCVHAPIFDLIRLSWVNGLECAAGLINPIGERDVKSTPLSDDEVREINLDAVATSWRGVHYEKYQPDVVYRNPAWQNE